MEWGGVVLNLLNFHHHALHWPRRLFLCDWWMTRGTNSWPAGIMNEVIRRSDRFCFIYTHPIGHGVSQHTYLLQHNIAPASHSSKGRTVILSTGGVIVLLSLNKMHTRWYRRGNKTMSAELWKTKPMGHRFGFIGKSFRSGSLFIKSVAVLPWKTRRSARHCSMTSPTKLCEHSRSM